MWRLAMKAHFVNLDNMVKKIYRYIIFVSYGDGVKQMWDHTMKKNIINRDVVFDGYLIKRLDMVKVKRYQV